MCFMRARGAGQAGNEAAAREVGFGRAARARVPDGFRTRNLLIHSEALCR